VTRDIILSGSVQDMRQQTATIATLGLISESCFLSPECVRHGHCRRRALELLALDATADDAAIERAIQPQPAFFYAFYCQGAAAVCASCGELIEPGEQACPNCGLALEELLGLLAKPEWERRLTTRGLEVAIATRLVVDELLMYTIFRSVRLLVLRNLASQSEQDSWEMRAREIREMVLDAWPEGSKPGRDTWEFRFIRTCAVFWLVAWPMLKERFTLAEIDSWNTRLVRAAAVSSQRWADAGAPPDDYAAAVEAILQTTGINREQAIQALAPSNAVEEAQRPSAPVVIYPPELIYERARRARSRLGDAWLLIHLEPAEDEALASKIGLEDPDEVARRFSL
jgi:RNA polymerase subunit RPABC4/transcription elongation factor Spt4